MVLREGFVYENESEIVFNVMYLIPEIFVDFEAYFKQQNEDFLRYKFVTVEEFGEDYNAIQFVVKKSQLHNFVHFVEGFQRYLNSDQSLFKDLVDEQKKNNSDGN